MAARRTVAANEIDGEAERLELPIAPELTDDEYALESVLASLGESDETARVLLYRSGESGKKDIFLRAMTPSEWLGYNQSGVLTDYGGGTYRVRVYNERSKLIKNVGFEIEAPRGISAARGPISTFPQPQIAAAAPVQNNDDKIIAAISALGAGFQTALGQIAQMLAQQQQAPSRQQMLEEMMALKNLFAPPAGAVQSGPDYIKVFMEAVQFAKDNVIPGGGENSSEWSPLIGVAKELLPPIIETYKAGVAVQTAQTPQPARVIHAGPVPVRPHPSGQPVPVRDNVQPVQMNAQSEENQMNLQIKMGVNFLLQHAAAGHDTITYADMLLDTLPEEVVNQFMSKSPADLIEYFAQYDPRVRDNAAWFTSLYNDIKEALTPDDNLGNIAEQGLPGATDESE